MERVARDSRFAARASRRPGRPEDSSWAFLFSFLSLRRGLASDRVIVLLTIAGHRVRHRSARKCFFHGDGLTLAPCGFRAVVWVVWVVCIPGILTLTMSPCAVHQAWCLVSRAVLSISIVLLVWQQNRWLIVSFLSLLLRPIAKTFQ